METGQFIPMDKLKLVVLTLTLLQMCTPEARGQCPSLRQECTCSYKGAILNAMACTQMGHNEVVPGFFNGSTALLQSLEIGQIPADSTVIRTLQNSAFDGLCLRSLTLTNIGIETVEEAAFSGLGQYLESLYIDQNAIQELPLYVFRELTELIYLHLERNRLSFVNRTYFQTLGKVQHIHLQGNAFVEFALDTFQDLASLDRLYLDFNLLTEVPSDIFDRLGNVKILNLQSNDIKQVSSDALIRLTALERFELQRNEITEISPDIFENNINLLHFDISFNHLQSIPANLFSGSVFVQYLDFGFNEITQIIASTFRSMRHLEYLFLRDNQLSSIPKNVFENLVDLLVLDLQNNQLSSLQIDYFLGLNKLKELLLQHNRIRTIEYGVFDILVDLQLLDLSANDITEFADTPFLSCKELVSLHLNDNKIMRITADLLRRQSKLRYLYFQQNNIRLIEQRSFDALRELRYLDLSENWLTDLSGRVFQQLVNLNTLKLSRNPLKSLDGALAGLIKLQELHLNNSCFEEIPTDIMDDLPRAETIYLRHNNLYNISAGSFVTSSLRVLDLAHCNLDVIEQGSIADDVTYLDLTGNPLQCDCQNAWLRAYFNVLHDPEKLVCTDPQAMANYYTVCYPHTSCQGVTWDSQGQTFCTNTPTVSHNSLAEAPGSPNDGVYVDTTICDLSKYPGLLGTTPVPTEVPSDIITNLMMSRSESYFVFEWDVSPHYANQIEGFNAEFRSQSSSPIDFDTGVNSLKVPVNALLDDRYAVCISAQLNGRRYNGLLCGEFIRALFTTTTEVETATQVDDDVTTTESPQNLSSKGGDKEGFSRTLTILVAASGGALLLMIVVLIVCCVLRKSKGKEKDTLPPPYTEFSFGSVDFKIRGEELVEQSSVSFPGTDGNLPANGHVDYT